MTTATTRTDVGSDGDLTLAHRGDRAAIRRCVHRLGPLVWSLVRSRTDDERLARTLAERSFARLWTSAVEFDASSESPAVFAVRLTRRELACAPELQTDGAVERGSAPVQLPVEREAIADPAVQPTELCREVSRLKPFLERLTPVQKHLLVATLQRGLRPGDFAAAAGREFADVQTELRDLLSTARELLTADSDVRGDRREVSA